MTDADLALRATYRIWCHEKVRFGDLDRHNHVNNVALCSMFENARVELRETLAPAAARDPDLAWVLVTFAITFLGSMTYPGTVAIGTRPLDIGRTSFMFGQAAFDGERCLATARAKTVCVERATGKSTPLPSDYREVLRRSL